MTGEEHDGLHEHQVVGARLRDARLAIGLTQSDIAGALGISRPSIAAIEKGTRKVTGLELRRMARLYRCSVGWLLGDEDDAIAGTDTVLHRATAELSDDDKQQVLRFAQFLAAQPPPIADGTPRPRPRPPTVEGR
jgi:transcriptional regulator with XRE-family HTH domain